MARTPSGTSWARCFAGLSRRAQQHRMPPSRCSGSRLYSSETPKASPAAAAASPGNAPKAVPSTVHIRGRSCATDPSWFNVPKNVLEAATRQLLHEPDHPLSITRRIIESHFPPPTFRHYNDFNPVVSTVQNFDSLGFPPDHPGRALTDTYYLNRGTLLRTHTSAHQADVFRANESDGYLISADVYRRDEIDRSHYPVFHQMEGARSWDRNRVPAGDVAAAVLRDLDTLPAHGVDVEDPNPPFHADRNPLQEAHHSAAEVEAIGSHLKRSLEKTFVDIFSRAQAAALAAGQEPTKQPLRMRWVEAYFPFTSPSWELEVHHQGEWVEVLGCGVVKHDIHAKAGLPSQLGWAFGLGLERIAMLLFGIPDIRLFWSLDERFLSQFRGGTLRRFASFSKYPPCPKDVSFWLPPAPASASAAGGNPHGGLHDNDVMEVVRSVAGDVVEDVKLFDQFEHRKTGRRSRAYRIVYRSLSRTLTHEDTNKYHEDVKAALKERLGVELR